MVVIRRTVRAASVPVGHLYGVSSRSRSSLDADVEPVSDLYSPSALRRISNSALDDADALMSASKRHDRQLISDINSRLANASFSQPVVKRKSTAAYQKCRPPLPPGRLLLTTTPTRRYTGLTAVTTVNDDDDDVLDMMPSTPVTRSVIRSSSVPPRLPPSVSRDILSAGRRHVTSRESRPVPTVVYHHHSLPVYDNTEMYPLERPVTSPSSSLSAATDLAVRQAHRNLDRIDREIKQSSDSYLNGPRRFSSKTYVSDQSPVRSRRLIYGGGTSPSWYLRSSAGSAPLPSRITDVHSSGYRTASPLPSELLLFDLLPPPPSPSLPARSVVTSHSVKSGVLPNNLQVRSVPSDLLTDNLVDTGSPLLQTDAYTLHNNPGYNILPTTYVLPSKLYSTSDVIKSAPTSPWSKTTSFEGSAYTSPYYGKPKVSDTRRKVRDVLCKIKNDPHYYD